MGYGKPKYGSDQKFQKTGKPGKGPGNNFIRVMPPMHSLADEGKWAIYYTTHWGYSGVSRSDAGKTVVRPFRCIEDRDFRSKLVRQACPECEDFRVKEKEAGAYEAKLKTQGKSDADIKNDPTMKSYSDWLQAHAPERKWYINVMYKDRTFGDFKINHKTHKKGIDSKIAELLETQQIDALDPDQGVFFNIKRLGDGFSVPDVVEVDMTMQEAVINGRTQMVPVVALAPLTEEEKVRGLKECRDLATLGGTKLSEQQIAALVNSDGSPERVDEIFGDTRSAIHTTAADVARTFDEAPETTREDGDGALASPPAGKGAPTITPEMRARAEAVIARKKTEADAAVKAKAEAAAKRAADAVKAAKAAEAAASAPPAAEAPAADPLKMDDDEFLKFFNAQQA